MSVAWILSVLTAMFDWLFASQTKLLDVLVIVPHQSERGGLFQIVFLVSQIPGIAALANPESPDGPEREMVDIIYFPTGGGKTEAYLGVLVFHCFFDRLRGKQAGVTAWTRFPLRLLTLQQTQRMSDIIGMAELVRRAQDEPRLKNAAGFAVGYFVGKESTPNALVNINNLPKLLKPTPEATTQLEFGNR